MTPIIGMAVVATVPNVTPTRKRYGQVIAVEDGMATIKWHDGHVVSHVLTEYLHKMVAS